MRLPRVRFTVLRTLIGMVVTVAILMVAAGVAWLLSPEQVRLRSLINAYNAKAKRHAELESQFARLAKYSDKSHAIAIRGGQRVQIPIRQRPALVPRYLQLAMYHRELRQKYENAAWYPRLPVEPDPPAPEPGG